MRRTYLDHAATTPMLPEAVEAMTEQLSRVGNASSLHGSGRRARRVVEEARELIAERVGARPTELIFTSGGTEADNLALKGGYWARKDPARTEIVVSSVEHRAVLDSVEWLEQAAGARVTLLPVTASGVVEPEALSQITERTALVSLIWGNNEVGTLQPVREAAARAAACGAVSHSDAVQSVGHVEVDFGASGLDLMTFTGHKLGGPYGVGALLARRQVALTAVQHGGGQERDVRSGTLDVAAVAGFAAAVEVATDNLVREEIRIRALRDELVEAVLACVDDVVVHGPSQPEARLPGIVNIGFRGCVADSVLMLLDGAGVDCSTGSACSAGLSQPSHVLMAMGQTTDQARSALRFSLGHTSTSADVAALVAALPDAVAGPGRRPRSAEAGRLPEA